MQGGPTRRYYVRVKHSNRVMIHRRLMHQWCCFRLQTAAEGSGTELWLLYPTNCCRVISLSLLIHMGLREIQIHLWILYGCLMTLYIQLIDTWESVCVRVDRLMTWGIQEYLSIPDIKLIKLAGNIFNWCGNTHQLICEVVWVQNSAWSADVKDSLIEKSPITLTM